MRGERLVRKDGTSESNTSRQKRESLARSTEEDAQKKTNRENKWHWSLKTGLNKTQLELNINWLG